MKLLVATWNGNEYSNGINIKRLKDSVTTLNERQKIALDWGNEIFHSEETVFDMGEEVICFMTNNDVEDSGAVHYIELEDKKFHILHGDQNINEVVLHKSYDTLEEAQDEILSLRNELDWDDLECWELEEFDCAVSEGKKPMKLQGDAYDKYNCFVIVSSELEELTAQ